MNYIKLDINAGNFIESYRNIGYSLQTAIADVIDNSIFAEATQIRIVMDWETPGTTEPYIMIIDNGIGMNNSELIESMRLACKSPSEYRNPNDLGRFGLGLKSASFSQCNLLSVVSKRIDSEPSCKQWDIEHVKDVGQFEIADCDPYQYDLNSLLPENHGTAVIWTELDQLNIPPELSPEKKITIWNQIMKDVYDHIAITYGSYKGKIKFLFNDNPITLWDPFFSNHPHTNIIANENIEIGDKKIHITSYILPSKMTPEELRNVAYSSSVNDLQGFYIYRNNRLIVSSTWLGLKKLYKKEAYRLARIRIDIDNSMDDLWHIDIKKENAICPPEIYDKLLAYAQKARTQSSKIYRSKGKTIKRKNDSSDNTVYCWNHGIKNQKPFFSINRKNPVIENFLFNLDEDQQKDFNQVLKVIENTIPVMSILEIESNSNGSYTENTSEELSDKEIEELFLNSVNTAVATHNISFDEAAEYVSIKEPFIYHIPTIERIMERECNKNND